MGRRGSFDKGDGDDFPTRSFNDLPPHDLLPGPIPSLDQNVWLEDGDQFKWGGLIEDSNIINTSEARENLASFLDRQDGTPGALYAMDGTITIDPDNQNISQGFRLLQITYVTDVKEVETPVREDNPFALFLQVMDDPLKLFSSLDFFFHHLNSYQIWPCESNALGFESEADGVRGTKNG